MILGLAVLSFVGTGFAAMIKGTLTKIDGSFYMVKDDKGKEHKIHFNDKTKKEGDIKDGAMVEVDEAQGHANSIKAAAPAK
jgi:hypothetical protein